MSGAIPPHQWDSWTAALLSMQGTGQYYAERITLHENGDLEAPAFLDYHGMMLSDNYTAKYPGGAKYTLDTGFLSLAGSDQTITWETNSNGSSVTFNRTLPDAYLAGYAPSISYGLHVGSVEPNVTASLVIGGYDSSRCLEEPLTSDKGSLELTSISLNVSSGRSAYLTSPGSANMLQSNGQSLSSLEVYPGPSVPYLYLPKSTCDAMASYLPVTYSSEWNLYLWDTSNTSYQQIVTSPHYISFTFSASGRETTTNVPFAVLNLTLESPLTSTPTSYFPCSPWSDTASAPYHLGRAFLQAAFIAQNWQTNSFFLSQAPGPDYLPPSIKTITSTDTSITPATNPPDWASTWSNTLRPLPANAGSSGSSNTHSSGKPKTGKPGLSDGAIAGIVVGVIAAVAITAAVLIWSLRRKRRQQKWPGSEQQQQRPGQDMSDAAAYHPEARDGIPYAQKQAQDAPSPPPVYEADTNAAVAEMDANTQIGELPADARKPPGRFA